MNNIYILIQKMIFIYNALLSGWTIKMIDKNQFEFRKSIEQFGEGYKDVYLETYLRKFIKYNMNINNTK